MAQDRVELIKIFQDTMQQYQSDPLLASYVSSSIKKAMFIKPENSSFVLSNEKRYEKSVLTITKNRTFEAAMKAYQEKINRRVGVLNFASPVHPGGGVENGARAQEECLCRCSTLFPVLCSQTEFYRYNNNKDQENTDAIIFCPSVVIFKTDTEVPQMLPPEQWGIVDVITCAAPNLGRGSIETDRLFEIHKQRADRILTIAAAYQIDYLVLGAFGCGAFRNNPEVVASAYKDVLSFGKFSGHFEKIEFAVYCPPTDYTNYNVFKAVLSGKS